MGAAAGQNLIRPTDQWDTTTPGQRYDDPVIWANMDYLVEAARERGVFVVIDLSGFRWLLTSQGADPSNARAWTTFIDFVAARYADSGNVAFYSIAGEPTPPTTQAQRDQLVAFYAASSQALRAADPNHLITVGGFNHMEDSPALAWWQAIDSLPDNDLVAFKTYSQHDLELMPSIAAFSAAVEKPAVLEEFGMPQGYGDAEFAGGAAYNGLASGRAPFFQSVYASGMKLGVAAFVFWNMGCQTGSTSYEVSPRTPAP
jgi:endo-1,4-beta-mannosidase